jgi:hypothetical protein
MNTRRRSVASDDLEKVLDQAAQSLLDQMRFSNGFRNLGEASLAEATLVIHIAAAFMRRGAAAWAESPFTSNRADNINHLDLLIDLSASDRSSPDLAIVEVKAVPPGNLSTKIPEIIKDITRVMEWPKLPLLYRPTFFYWSIPCRVRGVVAAILTERLAKTTLTCPPDALSRWWQSLKGDVVIKTKLREPLRRSLSKASLRKVIPGTTKDGGFQTSVAYAVFNCEVVKSTGMQKSAEHEAAHAIIALRLGLPIQEIALFDKGEHEGGVVCNWKQARGSRADRELVIAAFALAYAGAVIDLKYKGKGKDLQDVLNALPTDAARIKEARNTAIEWRIARTQRDTDQFTTAGFELALRLVPESWPFIVDLAEMLMEYESIDGDTLRNWYSNVIASSQLSQSDAPS